MSLESVYLFQDAGEQTRSETARIAVEESYAQGAYLFQAGDPADYLYILQSGWVRLTIARRGLLSHLVSDPGGAIGWSSMAGNGAYTASAECLIPVTVLKIGKDRLHQILLADPAGGLMFFKRLATMIGRRLIASYGATLSMQFPGDTRSYG